MSKNITIKKGDVRTTLKPKNEGQELITQTISDIKETGLPTNEELDAFGDKLWDLLEISKKSANNPQTEKLVETTQDFVTTLQDFVQEKNHDGLLQDIARKIKDSAVETTNVKESTKENIKSDAENIKDTLKNVAQMIYDISKEMINDSEFRDMLVTILDITTSSYERAEENTKNLDVKEAIKSDIKNKPVPTESGASITDKSDSDNKQKDFGKTVTSTQSDTQPTFHTTTQSSTTQPEFFNPTSTQPTFQPTTTVQPKTTEITYQPIPQPTTYQPSTQTTNQPDFFTPDSTKSFGKDINIGIVPDPNQPTSYLEDFNKQQELKKSEPNTNQDLDKDNKSNEKDHDKDNKSNKEDHDKDDDKSSKNVTGTKTEEVIKEKVRLMGKYMELSDQEKDTILRKVSAALLRFKKHPEYQPLVRNIFKLYDDILNIWAKIENDPSLNTAYHESESVLPDITTLIERASGISLDRFIGLVKKLEDVRQDPKYIETRNDIEDLLFKQPYETEQDIKENFEKIKNDMNELNDKYENLLDNLTEETKNIINGIGSDSQLTNIKDKINELVKEIFTDEHGRPTIEAAASSIIKIKNIFFPIIKHEFAYLAFPIIEIESKNYFFRIENFNLHLDHIIPDQLKIETDSKINIDLDKGKRHGVFNFRLLFHEITTKIKDLTFSLKKKTGIKYNDSGKVDISVKNATIDIAFQFKLREDLVDKIEVSKIDVHLHGMRIDIIESRHDVIDSIITSVFLPVVRSKITTQIKDALYDLLQEGICSRINEGLKNLEKSN